MVQQEDLVGQDANENNEGNTEEPQVDYDNQEDAVYEDQNGAGNDNQMDYKKENEEQEDSQPLKPEQPVQLLDGVDPTTMPPHGTEVFIAGIPRYATEEQVMEFCQQLGEVYKLDLSKDPQAQDGHSKGFGHCIYATVEQAKLALKDLHDTNFPGSDSKVRLSLAQKHNKLYVREIPRQVNREECEKLVRDALAGVTSVEVMMSKENPKENRGFCFVEFYNHYCAILAKQTLEKGFKIEDKEVSVSWAEPKKSDFVQQGNDKQKVVYVGQIPEGVTENDLKQLFTQFGELESASLHQHKQGGSGSFAFIHFVEASAARAAIDQYKASPPQISGKELTVNRVYDKQGSRGYQQGGFRGGRFNHQGGRGRGRYNQGNGFKRGGYGGYNSYDKGMYSGYGMRGGYGMYDGMEEMYDEGYMYDDGYGYDESMYDDYGYGYGYGYGMGMYPMMMGGQYMMGQSMSGAGSSRGPPNAGSMRRAGAGGGGGRGGSRRGGGPSSRYTPY